MKKIFHNIVIVILAGITFFWLLYSNKNYPKTADEAIYTLCARSFVEWTGNPNPFSKDVLLRYWNIGYEHPSFVKILSGFTWSMFHNRIGDLVSYRLATMINFSLLIVVLYIFSSHYLGMTIAVCASIFLLCIPEVVEYAHLAEVNINLSLLWFLTIIFFLKGLKTEYTSRVPTFGWIYVSGIIFGLALGSKMTTLIIPIAILLWIIRYRPEKSISAYIIFLIIGISTFILTWPSLWFEFPNKLIEHIKFHVTSIPVTPSKPWYFGLESFFSGIPPGLVILFIIGVVGAWIEGNKFGVLSSIIVFGMFVISSIPFFYPGQGIRYFLPAIPFVTVLCAMGLNYLIKPAIKRKITYV